MNKTETTSPWLICPCCEKPFHEDDMPTGLVNELWKSGSGHMFHRPDCPKCSKSLIVKICLENKKISYEVEPNSTEADYKYMDWKDHRDGVTLF